jgi:rhodanese-related sulfurtransferase/DNA-binding transcriptional ArsR family regulator
MGKAVSSPRRVDLLDLLSQGEMDVETLAARSGLTVKNTSAHLRTLRESRLVETRKAGTRVYYRLAGEEVFTFLREMQLLARKRLAEVERVVDEFYRDPDGMEPVAPDELLRRMDAGEVTVLDVRPDDEYRAGHVPGARSVPMAELQRRLQDLPRDREIVAYCRGPYCLLSIEAVAILRREGFAARLMRDGLPDFRAAGHAVATGAES